MEPKDQKKIGEILLADSEFLQAHNLMDYSLYMVVEEIGEWPPSLVKQKSMSNMNSI